MPVSSALQACSRHAAARGAWHRGAVQRQMGCIKRTCIGSRCEGVHRAPLSTPAPTPAGPLPPTGPAALPHHCGSPHRQTPPTHQGPGRPTTAARAGPPGSPHAPWLPLQYCRCRPCPRPPPALPHRSPQHKSSMLCCTLLFGGGGLTHKTRGPMRNSVARWGGGGFASKAQGQAGRQGGSMTPPAPHRVPDSIHAPAMPPPPPGTSLHARLISRAWAPVPGSRAAQVWRRRARHGVWHAARSEPGGGHAPQPGGGQAGRAAGRALCLL